jgi:hypothetical protein
MCQFLYQWSLIEKKGLAREQKLTGSLFRGTWSERITCNYFQSLANKGQQFAFQEE